MVSSHVLCVVGRIVREAAVTISLLVLSLFLIDFSVLESKERYKVGKNKFVFVRYIFSPACGEHVSFRADAFDKTARNGLCSEYSY